MPDTSSSVIVASSDIEQRHALARILENLGYETTYVSRVSECGELMRSRAFALVFCDLYLEDGSYRNICDLANSFNEDPRVVLSAASRDEFDRREMPRGMLGIVKTPYRSTEVEWMLIQSKRNRMKRDAGKDGSSALSLSRIRETAAYRHAS